MRGPAVAWRHNSSGLTRQQHQRLRSITATKEDDDKEAQSLRNTTTTKEDGDGKA